jgi:hypothetical protein
MEPDRDPRSYVGLPLNDLYLLLSRVVYDLASTYEELSFLRPQELSSKRLSWETDTESSIQARDRAASYSAASVTGQILEAEANLSRYKEERAFIERLIDRGE